MQITFDGYLSALDYLAENYRFDKQKSDRVVSDLNKINGAHGDSSFFVHTDEMCLLRYTGWDTGKPEYTLYVAGQDDPDYAYYRHKVSDRYNNGGITFFS